MEKKPEQPEISKGFNTEKIVYELEADLLRLTSLSHLDWVKYKAGKFREIIDSNPGLLLQYFNDRESTVKTIKRLLFGVRENK